MSEEKKQPPISTQVSGLGSFLTDTAKEVLSGGQLRATPEEAAARYATCLSCPLFVKMPNRLGVHDGAMRCEKCGCAMGKKVKWKSATCPEGKW